MLLLRLTCCCFLIFFVDGRGIASDTLTWLQLHDEGVTVHQKANRNEISSENMGHGLVARDRLNQNNILENRSEEIAEKGKTEEQAVVEKNIKKSMYVKVRPKSNVEMETEANAQSMKEPGTPVKPKWQRFVGKETIPKKERKSKNEERKNASATETRVEDIALPKLKVTMEGELKDDERVKKLRPALSAEVEAKIRYILRSEAKAKELQNKLEPKGVQQLETRGFPESLSKAFSHSTSGLMKRGGVVNLGMRTIQPYVEWTKTFCRNLPINHNFFGSPFRTLVSFGGGLGGVVKRDARVSKSKRSKIQPVDLGLKTLPDDKQIKILSGSDDDEVSLPVTHDDVEIFKTSPQSPTKISKVSPPTYTKKSPPKKRKGGNGSGVPGEESDGVFGAGKKTRESTTPLESPEKSPKKSPVNDGWDVDGDGVEDQVPRSRYGFTPQRLQEATLFFKTRRKEMGLSSDDDEEDRRPKHAVSSDLVNHQVYIPGVWKQLEQEYGKQQT